MASCPNCSIQLARMDVPACPACNADFGPGSAWRPVSSPTSASKEGPGWWRLIFVVPLVLVGVGLELFFARIGIGGFWAIPMLVLAAWIWFARSPVSLGIALTLAVLAFLFIWFVLALLGAMASAK